MRWRREDGQTTTEYLMISGMMAVVGALILKWMHVPFRQRLQEVVQYIINGVADPPW